VTIIVLILLAGVSIHLVLGPNGIVNKAKEASGTTKKESAVEKVQLMLADYLPERQIEEKALEEYLNEQKEKQITTQENRATDEAFCKMIDDIKHRYVEETEGLAMKDRFEALGTKLFEVVNKTAALYYPDSKYPLYELTIEELILFMHYLSNRIDDVFDKPILRPFKQMSVSQIMKWLDTKKKIEENKGRNEKKETYLLPMKPI